MESDESSETNGQSVSLSEHGVGVRTRSARSNRENKLYSKRRVMDRKKEALRFNKRRCRVWRWRRRRVRIKENKNGESEMVKIGEDAKGEMIWFRRRLRTVGDIAAALYHEGNQNSWGKDKGYALKLVRNAKENLIAFFQHILTSAEPTDVKRMTLEFAEFHRALGTIEDTKIFGKRSKRWGAKLHEMQQQKRSMMMSATASTTNRVNTTSHLAVNSKSNPIHIASSNNSSVQCSPQKLKAPNGATSMQQRPSSSTEPLLDVAMRRPTVNQPFNAQRPQIPFARSHPAPYPLPQRQHPQHQQPPHLMNGVGMRMPMRPTPGWHSVNGQARHWSMRGYPSSMNAAKGYYGGPTLNEQWRHELAGDAQKLRARQMAERQRLDDDKQSLQNDLDSHLTPILTPKSISKQMAPIPNGVRSASNGNNTATVTPHRYGPRPMSSAPSSSNGHKLKHHALFDSLKAPVTTPKKQKGRTSQSANRASVSAKGSPSSSKSKAKSIGTLTADSNAKKEDTDSTVSTSTATSAPTECKKKKSNPADTVKVGEGDGGSKGFHFDFASTNRVLEAIRSTNNKFSPKQTTNDDSTTINTKKRVLQTGTSPNSPSRKRIKLHSK